jgi:hypothetical protein
VRSAALSFLGRQLAVRVDLSIEAVAEGRPGRRSQLTAVVLRVQCMSADLRS